MSNKKLPEHLQKILDNREEKFKSLGIEKAPSDFLAECYKKAEKVGDKNALIHGLL